MKTLLLLAALAGAPPAPCPDLEVADAWVREPTPGADVLAAYATLHNAGGAPLTLDGFSGADFGMAMLHRTVIENGMSRMREAGPLTLAPGERMALAPGGLHLMLMNPKRTLHAGDRTVLDLACHGASRPFEFTVKGGAE